MPRVKLSTTTKKKRTPTTPTRATKTKRAAPTAKKKVTPKKSGRVDYQTLVQTLLKNNVSLQKAATKDVTAQHKQITRLTAQFQKASGKKASEIKALEKQWKKISEQLVESEYLALCMQALTKAVTAVKIPKLEKMPSIGQSHKAPAKGAKNTRKTNIEKKASKEGVPSTTATHSKEEDLPFSSDDFEPGNSY